MKGAAQQVGESARGQRETASIDSQIDMQKLALHTARTPKQRRQALANLDYLRQQKRAQP